MPRRWSACGPSSVQLMAATGLTPQTDKMPLDEGIKTELPAQGIQVDGSRLTAQGSTAQKPFDHRLEDLA